MNRRGWLSKSDGWAALSLVAGLALSTVLIIAVGTAPAAQRAEADVFVARALLAYEEKRYEDALAALRQALEIDPSHVDALYYTGLVRVAQGRLNEAAEPLEKARSLAPQDEAILFQLGVVYFGLETYDEAEPLFERAFAAKPEFENLGYYVGFLRYRRGDYQGALRAFAAGTSKDPTIQQLTRFYTGLALGYLGLPERAAAEVEEAIKLQPGSALSGPAERLRDAIIATRARERRFRAEVRVGFFYDTNVSVTPLHSNDDISEAIRLENTRRGVVRSPGELGALRLEYSWLRTGPWEATVGYSFFQTINNDAPSFNLQDHLGMLTGFYRGVAAGMPYQLGAQYAFDLLTLGGDRFLDRHAATLFGALVENTGNLTTALARVEVKDFADDPSIREEVRDARSWTVGFAHTFRFAGDKHLIRLGYQFDVEDAEGRNFDYVGHRALAGFQYTLPWKGIRLKYDFDLHRREYLHNNSILPASAPGTTERRDTEQTHVVRLELPLPYSVTLSVEYQANINRSNLASFTYDRHVASLILSWLY